MAEENVESGMIVLETSEFKGSLLGLLGKELEWVVGHCAPQRIVNEKGIASRLVWEETARDETSGKRFEMLLMARIYDKKVWAVGIWAKDYFLIVKQGDNKNHFFAAVPADSENDINSVNWIVMEDDRLKQLGVEE